MNNLKNDIYNILINDGTYIGLLGDPDTDPYRTFYIQPPEKPELPEVIYRFGSAVVSQEMVDYRAMQVSLTVTIWTKDASYETIADRVIYLLNQRPVSVSYGIRIVLDTVTEEIYDEELRAFGRAVMFQVFYRRLR